MATSRRAAPIRNTTGTAAYDNAMRAIVQDTDGSADVLRLTHIVRPEAAANEVLLQVHAAGLDRGTWHLAPGTWRPYLRRLALGVPQDQRT